MTDSETELPAPDIENGISKARHPKVIELVRSAIAATEDRKGATVIGIKKWITANYPEIDQSRLKGWLRSSFKKGLESGEFVRPKNSQSAASVLLGRYKLGKDPKKAKTAKKRVLKKKVAKKVGSNEDEEAKVQSTPVKGAKGRKRVASRSHSLSPRGRKLSKSKQLRRSISLTPGRVVVKKVKKGKTQKETSKKSPTKKSSKKSKSEDAPDKVPKKKSEKAGSATEKKAKAKDAVKNDKPNKKPKKETGATSKSKKKTAASKD